MVATLDRLIGVIDVVARVSAWITGLLLTLGAVVIGIDIALRNTITVTIGGANELSGYAFGIASSWALTVALRHRSHVRIDTVYAHLPPRARAWLDIIGLIAFIWFMTLVTWYAEGVLEQSIISNSHSISALEVPLAIPQAFWFCGFAVFLIAATLLLVRAVIALVQGDLRGVHALIGARSTEEDLREEQASLAALHEPPTAMRDSAT